MHPALYRSALTAVLLLMGGIALLLAADQPAAAKTPIQKQCAGSANPRDIPIVITGQLIGPDDEPAAAALVTVRSDKTTLGAETANQSGRFTILVCAAQGVPLNFIVGTPGQPACIRANNAVAPEPDSPDSCTAELTAAAPGSRQDITLVYGQPAPQPTSEPLPTTTPTADPAPEPTAEPEPAAIPEPAPASRRGPAGPPGPSGADSQRGPSGPTGPRGAIGPPRLDRTPRQLRLPRGLRPRRPPGRKGPRASPARPGRPARPEPAGPPCPAGAGSAALPGRIMGFLGTLLGGAVLYLCISRRDSRQNGGLPPTTDSPPPARPHRHRAGDRRRPGPAAGPAPSSVGNPRRRPAAKPGRFDPHAAASPAGRTGTAPFAGRTDPTPAGPGHPAQPSLRDPARARRGTPLHARPHVQS